MVFIVFLLGGSGVWCNNGQLFLLSSRRPNCGQPFQTKKVNRISNIDMLSPSLSLKPRSPPPPPPSGSSFRLNVTFLAIAQCLASDLRAFPLGCSHLWLKVLGLWILKERGKKGPKDEEKPFSMSHTECIPYTTTGCLFIRKHSESFLINSIHLHVEKRAGLPSPRELHKLIFGLKSKRGGKKEILSQLEKGKKIEKANLPKKILVEEVSETSFGGYFCCECTKDR